MNNLKIDVKFANSLRQTTYSLGLNDNMMGQWTISEASSIAIMTIVDMRHRNHIGLMIIAVTTFFYEKNRFNFAVDYLLCIIKKHCYTTIMQTGAIYRKCKRNLSLPTDHHVQSTLDCVV